MPSEKLQQVAKIIRSLGDIHPSQNEIYILQFAKRDNQQFVLRCNGATLHILPEDLVKSANLKVSFRRRFADKFDDFLDTLEDKLISGVEIVKRKRKPID